MTRAFSLPAQSRSFACRAITVHHSVYVAFTRLGIQIPSCCNPIEHTQKMELLGQLAQTLQATVDQQESYIGACERALSSLRAVSEAAAGRHGSMMVVDEEHQASSTAMAEEGRRPWGSAMMVVDEEQQGHDQASSAAVAAPQASLASDGPDAPDSQPSLGCCIDAQAPQGAATTLAHRSGQEHHHSDQEHQAHIIDIQAPQVPGSTEVFRQSPPSPAPMPDAPDPRLSLTEMDVVRESSHSPASVSVPSPVGGTRDVFARAGDLSPLGGNLWPLEEETLQTLQAAAADVNTSPRDWTAQGRQPSLPETPLASSAGRPSSGHVRQTSAGSDSDLFHPDR